MGTTLKQVWTGFLLDPEPADHAVQIYREPEELARSVGAYLAAGLARGEPAVVIATPEHRSLVSAELPSDETERLVRWLDAEETLAALLVDGRPDPDRFELVVGGVLDEVAEQFPDRLVRAFGEMVDLLARRGDRTAAVELERLWSHAARTRRFSLLCAYRADPFAVDEQVSLLPSVCAAHSPMLPAADPERFQRAVDAALYETLGPDDASRVYRSIAGAVAMEPGVPVAQHALMWVSANMPARAEIVVAEAQRRYRPGLDARQPAAAQ